MLKFADINPQGRSQALPRDRGGFALVTVLVLLVVLSTLTVFLLSSSGDSQRAGQAMRESARSFYAADAGVNAVVAHWRALGYDTLTPNPGDSADLGWTTLENGARYRAVLVRVDGGSTGDAIHSVRVVGQGAGASGGSTTIFREITFNPSYDGNAAIEGGTGVGGGGGGGDEDDGGGCGGDDDDGGGCASGGELTLQWGSSGSGDDDDGGGSSGSSGTGVMVNGLDTIPAGWAAEGICEPVENKPGVTWQDSTDVNIVGGGGGGDDDDGGGWPGGPEVVGAPRMLEDAGMTSSSLMDFGSLSYDDLVGMADITITSDINAGIYPEVSGSQCNTGGGQGDLNWGDPYDPNSPCFDYFPIIHFPNSGAIQSPGGYGQGILLLDDALAISNIAFDFYGLIILKDGTGALTLAEADVNIYGAILAHGDVLMTNGALVRYSKCSVQRAADVLMGEAISQRVWRQATN